jgi:ATP-dependent HslUV protease subunit HslV
MIGDGQMTLGSTVVKSKTVKVRRIQNVLVGVAGSTADALTLLEKFEKYLDESNGQLLRATVGLAKQWRTDKMMGKLQAVMCLSDHSTTLLFDGEGNIIEPDDGRILAIGSGGSFALSAARALIDHSPLDAESIARESMKIAADLCIYTNSNFTSITLDAPPKPDDQPFV